MGCRLCEKSYWQVFMYLSFIYTILFVLIFIVGFELKILKGIADIIYFPFIMLLCFPILIIMMITGPIFGNFYPIIFTVIFAILNLFIQAYIIYWILSLFKTNRDIKKSENIV